MVQYSNCYKSGIRIKTATPAWGQTDFQVYTHILYIQDNPLIIHLWFVVLKVVSTVMDLSLHDKISTICLSHHPMRDISDARRKEGREIPFWTLFSLDHKTIMNFTAYCNGFSNFSIDITSERPALPVIATRKRFNLPSLCASVKTYWRDGVSNQRFQYGLQGALAN